MSDEYYNSLTNELEYYTNRYIESLNKAEVLRIYITDIEGRIARHVYKD